MFRAMVNDDEGKKVPLVRFGIGMWPFTGGPLPSEVQRVMHNAARRAAADPKEKWSARSLVRTAVVGVLLPQLVWVPFFAAMALGLVIGNMGHWLWLMYASPVLGLLAIVMILRYRGAVFMPEAKRVAAARAAARLGYCGSCGYPLPTEANTDVGLHRCSECGAAWQK